MRRALVAGALLGVVAGVVFVHRDVLRITVVWPMILGFALWDTVGERGSRGFLAAIAAGAGTAAGYGVFFVVSEFMPVTDLSLGIVTGAAVGVMVTLTIVLRKWFPVSAPLIGFAAFFGVFEPQWRTSPSNFLSHGIDAASEVGLGLVVGALTASVARWLIDRGRVHAEAREGAPEPEPAPPATDAPLSELIGGSGS
jgi:hypothetical protein